MASVAAALLSLGALAAPVMAADAVTGQIVYEATPAVFDYVTDPVTEETTTIVVSPPVYQPVMATVIAYGPGQGGGPAKQVASVPTDADGTFSIAGLTQNVYLQVLPVSSDWQPGWLWVEYMSDDPLFASYVQRSAPPVFDVTPSMDLGMIQLQTALANGRVVDLVTGQPIAGATVRYDPVEGGRKAFSTTTDVTGVYTFAGLDYEEYSIRVSARKYVGGYLGAENLLYASFGEAGTWPGGPLPGDVIKMARR
ncbi:carboxypeptidase regulatory-like domain-containing protein [Humibacillus xanthopallidus]|uniref:carboxypeptidase regulatory-like domain-containing protein n=1 Tax=Humibacillus xanthopallidus TaxID=412689 RepID=UPI00384E35F1